MARKIISLKLETYAKLAAIAQHMAMGFSPPTKVLDKIFDEIIEKYGLEGATERLRLKLVRKDIHERAAKVRDKQNS